MSRRSKHLIISILGTKFILPTGILPNPNSEVEINLRIIFKHFKFLFFQEFTCPNMISVDSFACLLLLGLFKISSGSNFV